MIYSREKMLMRLENACSSIRLKEIFFAELSPQPDEPCQAMAFPRIILPVSGIKQLQIASKGIITEINLEPGQAVFIRPYCWAIPVWGEPVEMLSLVMHSNVYLRLIYVRRIGGPVIPPFVPDEYYHVEDTLSRCTVNLMGALESFDYEGHKQKTAVRILESLLDSATLDLKRSHETRIGKAQLTWRNLVRYMQENFTTPLTRDNVAEAMKLTPRHVSYLFKNFSNMQFSDYLNKLRLSHAAFLLRQTDLSLGEISWKTGYSSTSYFVRVFKKYYSITPTAFRRESALPCPESTSPFSE